MYTICLMKNVTGYLAIDMLGQIVVKYNDEVLYKGIIHDLDIKYLDSAVGIYNSIADKVEDFRSNHIKIHPTEKCRGCNNAYITYTNHIIETKQDDVPYFDICLDGYCDGRSYSVFVSIYVPAANKNVTFGKYVSLNMTFKSSEVHLLKVKEKPKNLDNVKEKV